MRYQLAVVTTSSSLSGDDLLSAGRPDFKGIRTYHISGTCGDASISRITCGRMGYITVISNAHSWQDDDLTWNQRVAILDLDMPSIVVITPLFLSGCVNLRRLNLASLRAVEVLPEYFLSGCRRLGGVDLTPLVNLREVGRYFLSSCTNIKSIDLTPLRAVEVLPDGFLNYCNGLEAVDLSPLTHLADVGRACLENCTSLKVIRLAPHQPTSLLPSYIRELAGSVEQL